jgi:hypothetical protein
MSNWFVASIFLEILLRIAGYPWVISTEMEKSILSSMTAGAR